MRNRHKNTGYHVDSPTFLAESASATQDPVIVKLNVMTNDGPQDLILKESDMSKHILALGGIGSGKTNLIDLLLDQVCQKLTNRDVVVIFDTKGDYLRKFSSPGDIVFGNLKNVPQGVELAKWNIYREAMIDPEHVNANLIEICKSLFMERSLHNNNPFFPNAGRDILYSVMTAHINERDRNKQNNASLLEYFQNLDLDQVREQLSKHSALQSSKYYISGNTPQTQGVVSEVVQLVKEIFTESFAQNGQTSIREAIRRKGKRKIFIEYDLGIGNMLTPVYRLLLDMAIKEALCRDRKDGNVYVFIDEFALLPRMQHIADGVNFGRELGIKLIAGLQNTEQLVDAYGEHAAASILSGFNTRFFFKVNDSNSREYVQKLLGTARELVSFDSTDTRNGQKEEILTTNVLEDWVYETLPVGTAVYYQNGKKAQIVGLPRFTGCNQMPINTFDPNRQENPPHRHGSSSIQGFQVLRK